MKTKTTRITVLIFATLFGTAWTAAAIDFNVPSIPKELENAQKQLEKANSPSPAKLTANPQTVQIPAGQSTASTRLSWSIGSGRPIIVVRVKGEDGVSTDLQTLPAVPGPGFISQPQGSLTVPVKPGKNVFSLNQAGKRLALVSVEGERSSPSAPVSAPQPPSSKRPTITANPAVAISGSTTLTWDGGPEHPYAEVWVGINGQDPTFVVEQGRGSRRVTIEPGKTYRYILTDSAQELATVTVRGSIPR